MACIANINIQPAIAVYIFHGNTGIPMMITLQTGFCGDVFKFPVAFIEVEFVVVLVWGKKNIWFAIIINVANGNATAVVKVVIVEDVHSIIVLHIVAEGNVGLGGWEEVEERISLGDFFLGMAGKKANQYYNATIPANYMQHQSVLLSVKAGSKISSFKTKSVFAIS